MSRSACDTELVWGQLTTRWACPNCDMYTKSPVQSRLKVAYPGTQAEPMSGLRCEAIQQVLLAQLRWETLVHGESGPRC